MIKLGNPSETARDSSNSKSAFSSRITPMDLKASKFVQCPSVFQSIGRDSTLEGDSSFYCTNKDNPFEDAFPDPLCKLNLKETSDFVKAFPMNTKSSKETSAQRRRGVSSVAQRRMEAPSTPGRPIFSFSPGIPPRRSIPSKWDDAEKWLISSSCHDSPAHAFKSSEPPKISRQHEGFHPKGDAFAEDLRFAEEKVPAARVQSFHGPVVSLDPALAFHGVPSEAFLKGFIADKFTDNVEPVFSNVRYSEPMKEGFVFRNSLRYSMKDAATEVTPEIHSRDIGTAMTPLGSSTETRCHTPIKSTSPARHNTPANRSGSLAVSNTSVNISELKDCHFAKLELTAQYDSLVSNWSSREEEEEEISKSLRHFEISDGRKSVAESRASAWEDEERNKSCIRYQREEAKIQAWVNLQTAKAEAKSRKLEVKIQKMRSNLEEKLMKRMALDHRRAEEWRAAAQLQHTQQLQRASEQAQKMKSKPSSHFTDHASCGCLPCNNNL